MYVDWIKDDRDLWEINKEYAIEIKWSRNYYRDLEKLSRDYFESAYKIFEEINSEIRINTRYDIWFLHTVYLFRRSMEQKCFILKIFLLFLIII